MCSFLHTGDTELSAQILDASEHKLQGQGSCPDLQVVDGVN